MLMPVNYIKMFKLHLRYSVNKNEWMKETFFTVWKQNQFDNIEK